LGAPGETLASRPERASAQALARTPARPAKRQRAEPWPVLRGTATPRAVSAQLFGGLRFARSDGAALRKHKSKDDEPRVRLGGSGNRLITAKPF